MVKKMTTFIAIALIALLLFNAVLFLRQPSMIFFPSAEIEATPQDWGLEYEDVNLTTVDGKQLHGWYIPHPDSNRVVLIFHGNAGNISHRGESVRIFHRMGLNVFIIDYRGYGKSQGKAGESGLYKDANAAWQYLTQDRNIDKDHIIIFGRSLGGAVATNLATEVQPAALILESTFSSVDEFAKLLFPIMSRVLVSRYHFNTLTKIKKINSPLLVLHSPADEMIPFYMGKDVFEAANQPKYFVTMKGDHNNGFMLSQPDYEQELKKFITSLGSE